jgi:ribosomal protein L32
VVGIPGRRSRRRRRRRRWLYKAPSQQLNHCPIVCHSFILTHVVLRPLR